MIDSFWILGAAWALACLALLAFNHGAHKDDRRDDDADAQDPYRGQP